jgi:hypothetical protein
MASRLLTRSAISPRPRTVVRLSLFVVIAMIAPWRRSVLLKKRKPSRRNSDDAASVHFLLRDESAIIGILPNWESGARRAPSIHDLIVAPVAFRQPLKKVEDESFHDTVYHRLVLQLAVTIPLLISLPNQFEQSGVVSRTYAPPSNSRHCSATELLASVGLAWIVVWEQVRITRVPLIPQPLT